MRLVKDLPEIFEQFSEQKRESFLEVKKYKEAGKPVIGAYCSYFPSYDGYRTARPMRCVFRVCYHI